MGKVLPKDLRQFTPNATIGLSLEEDIGLNYRYALPNKLFDYIQAEVPVIVADLPEMKKLVETYQVGEILWERSPKSLAKLILKVISNNYTIALQKAKRELTWTKEKDKLVAYSDRLMSQMLRISDSTNKIHNDYIHMLLMHIKYKMHRPWRQRPVAV